MGRVYNDLNSSILNLIQPITPESPVGGPPMIQLFGQSVAPLRAAEDAMALPPVGMRVLPASARGERRFFNLGVRRSLELHWRLPLAAAIAFTALAISYFLTEALVLKAWPAYRAESIVKLKPAAAKVLPDSGGQPRSSFDGDTYETYIQQKMMSVSRQDVLVSALHKLAGFQSAGESDQAAAQRLVRELEVTRLGPAYQFSIRARAGSPAMAAQIANTVTAAGIESAMRDDRTRNAQQMQMWTEERDRIQSALAADQAELDALNKQPRVTEAGVAMDRLQRLSELEAEIPLLRGRYAVVDEQWRDLTLEDREPAATYQVTPAVAPTGPSKSGVLRNAGLIGVAGLFFGVLAGLGFVMNRVGLKKTEEALTTSDEAVEQHLPAQGSEAAESVERANLASAESFAGEESLNNVLQARSLFVPEVEGADVAGALLTAPATPIFAHAAAVDSPVPPALAQNSAPEAEATKVDPSKIFGEQAVQAAGEEVASTSAEEATHFSLLVATPAVSPIVSEAGANALASSPLPAWREEPPAPLNGSAQSMKECEPAGDPDAAKTAAKPESERPWWLVETPGNAAPPDRALTWEPARLWTAHRTSADAAVQPVAVDFGAELRRLIGSAEKLSNHWPGPQGASRVDATLAPRPEGAPNADLEAPADDRMARMNALREMLLVMVAKKGSGGNGTTEHQDG